MAAAKNIRNYLIEEYFHMGFSYKEIIDCLLLIHELNLSLRQLKRVLSKKNLGRRRFTSFDEVVDAIEEELNSSGSVVGYRSMWQKLVVNHKLSVSKEFVRNADVLLRLTACICLKTWGPLLERPEHFSGP